MYGVLNSEAVKWQKKWWNEFFTPTLYTFWVVWGLASRDCVSFGSLSIPADELVMPKRESEEDVCVRKAFL